MSEVAKVHSILDPQRVSLAEYDMQVFVVNCELGIEIKDLSDPAYWSNVSYQMKPYDHIWARSEDGSWIAHLMVLSNGSNWAKVHVLSKHKLSVDLDADETNHQVLWKGPQRKFSIVRKTDGAVINEGFTEKPAAIAAMLEHERVTG